MSIRSYKSKPNTGIPKERTENDIHRKKPGKDLERTVRSYISVQKSVFTFVQIKYNEKITTGCTEIEETTHVCFIFGSGNQLGV